MVNADVLVNSEGGGDGSGTNARASQVNYLCAPGLHKYKEEVYRFIEAVVLFCVHCYEWKGTYFYIHVTKHNFCSSSPFF